jgi:hypothetical protein
MLNSMYKVNSVNIIKVCIVEGGINTENLRLKNSKASTVFQAAVIQFSALVGGSFFSVAGVPIMKRLGDLTINGTAMQGYLKLMMGYSLNELTGTLIALSGIAFVLFAAAAFVAAAAREV